MVFTLLLYGIFNDNSEDNVTVVRETELCPRLTSSTHPCLSRVRVTSGVTVPRRGVNPPAQGVVGSGGGGARETGGPGCGRSGRERREEGRTSTGTSST